MNAVVMTFTVATASQGGAYFVYGSGWTNLIADQPGLSGSGEVYRRPDPEPGAGALTAANRCKSAAANS